MYTPGKAYLAIKRIIDVAFALLLLVLCMPVLLAIYLLICGFGGKPLYTQQRVGHNRMPFKIYKFRTMIVDADDYLDDEGLPTKPRITKIGKWLRLLSLDELPQLLNVLNGSMSFVGPRPVLIGWDKKFNSDQLSRFNVKPGVTGLAQVNGRNSLPWSKRLEFDREYVENISFWLDVIIVWKTIVSVVKRKDIVADRNSDQVDDL